ncbi:hypothetical protein SERLADRAFT_456356 [Serpula lacrymans var. lacrymans S7.9]|uniref:Cytochrome P450 n=1 Tax=Serpula lacrymans var. lacrymans (strain S7.9) TaxID=578457 RepID=F8NJ00_SERL9|nr:uncharacterized protein SERLADRAFT_456356 [Serpula lacrymans var. lacrymans S7.9]EGO29033.1 hypothetical protein SERLADRAFT_456356 [Serpula lacrymans var. lacrymans S7.9]
MVNLYATIACGSKLKLAFRRLKRSFTGPPYTTKPHGEFNSSTQDPIASFGYGRRICPGRFMAYSSVWIGVTGIRTTFDITKAVDENGKMSQSMDTLLDWSVHPCHLYAASNLAQTMLLA